MHVHIRLIISSLKYLLKMYLKNIALLLKFYISKNMIVIIITFSNRSHHCCNILCAFHIFPGYDRYGQLRELI